MHGRFGSEAGLMLKGPLSRDSETLSHPFGAKEDDRGKAGSGRHGHDPGGYDADEVGPPNERASRQFVRL